jgi:hypothetical protein
VIWFDQLIHAHADRRVESLIQHRMNVKTAFM